MTIKPTAQKPIAATMEDTISVLIELNMQLESMAEFFFGDAREEIERPPLKCFEQSALVTCEMAKQALDRLMRIRERI